MDAIDALARGVSLFLVGLLVLSVNHKLRVLVAGTAYAEPLLTRGWRATHPTGALAGATVIEVAVAMALILLPAAGLAASAVLLLFYGREVTRLEGGDCNCFGSVLPQSPKVARYRNIALAVTSGACALLQLTVVHSNGIPSAAIGVALVGLAGLAAMAALERLESNNATMKNALR